MYRSIWLGSLPAALVDKGELQRCFRVYGKIDQVYVYVDKKDYRSWAIVTFLEMRGAKAALHGTGMGRHMHASQGDQRGGTPVSGAEKYAFTIRRGRRTELVEFDRQYSGLLTNTLT